MEFESPGIAPSEPLTLPVTPDSPNDERIHTLVERIETTLLDDPTAPSELSPRFRAYLRHLVYVAVTSDETYTLEDLVETVGNEEQYAQFWAQLDNAEIEHNVESFETLSDRLRRCVCDILDPSVRNTKLI